MDNSCMRTDPASPHPLEQDNANEVHVPRFLWQYANDHSLLNEAADDLRRYLLELASSASISIHTIEARAKSLASYEAKSQKTNDQGEYKYSAPGTQITDCIAARAILFTSRARADLADLISERTAVNQRHNPGEEKYNGYDSEHFIITSLHDQGDRSRYSALSTFLDQYPGLEIQLRSVAGHAWAEYEHDVRYKPGAYAELPNSKKRQIDQKFIEAGGMRRVMDSLFNDIQEILYPLEPEDVVESDPARLTEDLESEESQVNSDALTTEALLDFAMERFPSSKPGPTSYFERMRLQLDRLEVDAIADLSSALSGVESEEVFSFMDYPRPPTCARRLDDELLAAFGARYADQAAEEDRSQLLRLRLRRVRGKFAIYSIVENDTASRPVPAARAVRDLAFIVAREAGIEAATIADAISPQRDDLRPSSHPRPVKTPQGVLFVATNLSRRWAENIMRQLVNSANGYNVAIDRAGDKLF